MRIRRSSAKGHTTSTWPDDMTNNIFGIGEWSLTEEYYREQLAPLPLMAVTQLQAYNTGLIQAIINNIDATTVDIHGHNDSTNDS